jgi:hypothetical protein
MKALILVTMVVVVMTISKQGCSFERSITAGPPLTAFASTMNNSPDRAYKINRIMQVMGYALLGAGAVMAVTGAGLVQGSPYGAASMAGLVTFCTGLVHFITSAFLLGFSRPVIRQELPPVRPIKIIRKTSLLEGDILFTG